MNKIDGLCINAVRALSIDMVSKANSGHPGMPLGAAPMAYALWTGFLRHNPANPKWHDRDRFILSAGHGSALLYSLLHLTGYDLTIEDLKNFRQHKSRTPGHPEYGETPGVECTTGPLGQGFAIGVGMAIAERFLVSKFNRPDFEIVNHHTYAIVSDGDLMEGVASEAASLAGHLRLGKIIYLYDNNSITLAGETRLAFTEDVLKRFDAYGWHVQYIADGNDIGSISKAITEARAEITKPSLISVKTHIGYGSPKQDTFEAHGTPLNMEEVTATKKRLGWPDKDFFVPDEVLQYFRSALSRGFKSEADWQAKMDSYAKAYPDLKKQWDIMMGDNLPKNWDKDIPAFEPDPKGIATRTAGGRVINSLSKDLSLIGGSGDLDPSTQTALDGLGSFQSPESEDSGAQGAVSGGWGYGGANIAFGVREHAMGGILNGIALHGGPMPFGSTFLIFSDYMRPAIRLSALMGLHVIYVFTHDSIALGEDGPTHQPVEHLCSLRAMPNLAVIRPADANETAEAWRLAIRHKGGPVAIMLTRQKVPVIDRGIYAKADGLAKGAYILADSFDGPEIILIATGSEVHIALEAYERLKTEGIKLRVVSMPSCGIFEEQSQEYRDKVLPPNVKKRIVIEAGAALCWHKYAGDGGLIIGINRFGASAPGSILMKESGFTSESIINAAKTLL
jgi:transketolase